MKNVGKTEDCVFENIYKNSFMSLLIKEKHFIGEKLIL